FRHPQMTHYGDIAGGLDGEVRELERLEGGFARHHPVDEFGLVLEAGVRMAVAQLLRSERLDLRFVLFEPRGAQLLDGSFNCRLIGGLSPGRSQKSGWAQRGDARARLTTAPQVHSFA